MTQIHKVKCDNCGIEADMKKGFFGYYSEYPKGWDYMVDIKQTYCKKCCKKYKKCLKECMVR